jgi:hypothetical protein
MSKLFEILFADSENAPWIMGLTIFIVCGLIMLIHYIVTARNQIKLDKFDRSHKSILHPPPARPKAGRQRAKTKSNIR